MTDHPINDVFVDGTANSKAADRTYFKDRVRLRVGSASEVASNDYSDAFGLDLGGLLYDRDTGDTTTEHDGVTCLVDSQGTRFKIKSTALGKRVSVRVAATGNVDIATELNAGDAQDGVTLAASDLILLPAQTDASENGIYVVGTTPARSGDFDTFDDYAGAMVAVEAGDTNANTLWICTANEGGTLDTDDIDFTLTNITSSAIGGVTGPAVSVTNNIPTFADTTGDKIKDSGKAIPTGDVVGTTDTQTLTNKTLTAPDINGGTADALTSLSIRSTGAAFDVKLASTEALTADRTLTVDLNNANRTLTLGGNVNLTGAFTLSGSDATIFRTTAATDVTLPTTGTLATEDYVDTAVADIVDSSPAALDTLNELAAALGDDANFSTTTATALGNRLRFDAAQTLTSGQKTQVQANAGLVIGTDVQGFGTDTTGNAATATKLATARTIDGQSFDGSANITVIAPGTHAATSKTTPVDADEIPLVDSEVSNVLKKLTWANLKSAIGTYVATLSATWTNKDLTASSNKTYDTVGIALSDETTAITTGTNKATFSLPYAFTVTGVYATLNTASSSGAVTVDINEAGVSILSTKLTIDANEKTSATAATTAVISDASIAANAEFGFDIDGAGTGAKGLKVFITGHRT